MTLFSFNARPRFRATAYEEGWADSRQIPQWVRNVRIECEIRVRANGDPTDVRGNLSSAPLKIDVLQIEGQARF